SCTKSIPPQCY
nr:Chain A, BOWMAN-BIRK INHIBITOR DERIVED PEPTIDE [Macrotyloma axillare]